MLSLNKINHWFLVNSLELIKVVLISGTKLTFLIKTSVLFIKTGISPIPFTDILMPLATIMDLLSSDLKSSSQSLLGQ